MQFFPNSNLPPNWTPETPIGLPRVTVTLKERQTKHQIHYRPCLDAFWFDLIRIFFGYGSLLVKAEVAIFRVTLLNSSAAYSCQSVASFTTL